MKRLFSFLMICAGISTASWVDAKMVRYVDENGKTRYVNTDVQNVPPEYLDQVRDQLGTEEAQETEEIAGETKALPAEEVNSEEAVDDSQREVLVEVFVTGACSDCVYLEKLLRKYEIVYQRYDINATPYGSEKYKETGWEPPFVRVRDEWLHDLDPAEYESIIAAKMDEYEGDAMVELSGETPSDDQDADLQEPMEEEEQ